MLKSCGNSRLSDGNHFFIAVQTAKCTIVVVVLPRYRECPQSPASAAHLFRTL